VAVWFDILTVPGTLTANQFYREIEQWLLTNYSGSYAMVRPEWSKGWGYTDTAAWSDTTMVSSTIPNAYRTGQPASDNWDTARTTLNQYDPYRVFSSLLLDSLLPQDAGKGVLVEQFIHRAGRGAHLLGSFRCSADFTRAGAGQRSDCEMHEAQPTFEGSECPCRFFGLEGTAYREESRPRAPQTNR
jgi:hypothetical protein